MGTQSEVKPYLWRKGRGVTAFPYQRTRRLYREMTLIGPKVMQRMRCYNSAYAIWHLSARMRMMARLKAVPYLTVRRGSLVAVNNSYE